MDYEGEKWIRVPFCVRVDEVYWLCGERGQMRLRVRRKGKRSGWMLIEQRGKLSEAEESYALDWIHETVERVRCGVAAL
jgi:hypothetical protein